MEKLEWEEIEHNQSWLEPGMEGTRFNLLRVRVPGGWLVLASLSEGGGLTFVPDPTHAWQ